MFWVLIKKELKEQFPDSLNGLFWSFLLIAFFLRILDGVYHESHFGWTATSIPLAVANHGYLQWFSYLSYGTGAMLGLMMLLVWKKEANHWQFLRHFPLTLGQIFLGKAVAGILLFSLVVLCPYAFLVLWSCFLGNYPAPWRFEYLYPAGIICLESLFLFLGILFSAFLLTQRWKNFQMLAFCGIVPFFYGSFVAEKKSTSLICLLVGFLLLFWTAYSTFSSANAKRNRKLPSLILFLFGSTALFFLLQTLLITPSKQTKKITHVFFEAKQDKTFSQMERAFRISEPFRQAAYLKSVEAKKRIQLHNRDSIFLQSFVWQNTSHYLEASRSPEWGQYSIQNVSPNLVQLIPDSPLINLYLLHQEKIIALYDWETRQPLGYLGRNGFFQDKTAVQSFATQRLFKVESQWKDNSQLLLLTDEGLFRIHLKLQPYVSKDILLERLQSFTIDPLYLGEIYSWTTTAISSTWKYHRQLELTPKDFVGEVFRSKEHIFMYQRATGKIVLSFKVPEKLAQEKCLHLVFLEKDRLGLIAEKQTNSSPDATEAYLYKINPEGHILWEDFRSFPMEASRFSSNTLSRENLMFGITPFSLVVLCVYLQLEGYPMGSALLSLEQDFFLFLGILLGINAFLGLLGCAVLFRCRNIALSAKLAWVLFVLVGGIPALGIVFLLFLQEKRLPCPSCHQKFSLSLSHCPYCTQPWPKAEPQAWDLIYSNTGELI